MGSNVELVEEDYQSYKWYFILLFNVFITFILIYCAKNQFLPFTNHFIPDATFYEDHVMYSLDRGVANGFTSLNKLLYSVGPQSFLFYNTILLLLSVRLCTSFKVFNSKAVTWARAVIVCNPYFLISVLGPSKECNLTFLSLFSIFFFLKRDVAFKFIAIIAAIGLIAIRPQFGLCLLCAYAIYLLLPLIKSPTLLCIFILIGYFALNSIPAVNKLVIESQGGEDLPYFKSSSIYELAVALQLMSMNPILQIPAFIAKMCLVMFTPIARPNPITSSSIPLLDWGYTIMANILFPLNFGFLLLFLYPKLTKRPEISEEAQLLLIYAFLGVLSVIISPAIQFRYLFPYAPILAACFTLHRVKIRNRIFITSLFFAITVFFITAIWLPKSWAHADVIPVFLSWL